MHSLGILTLCDVLWHLLRYFSGQSHLQRSIQNANNGDVRIFLLSIGKAKFNTVSCIDEAGSEVDVTYFYGRSRQGMVAAFDAIQKLKDSDSKIVSGKIMHSEAARYLVTI